MSLPSKPQQIAAVAKFLDSDKTEGRDLDAVAKDIVEGYLDALQKGVSKPATPLREGMLIKHPADGKVRRIAWLEGDTVWLIVDNASYGWLGSASAEVWRYCEEFWPSRMVETGEILASGKPKKKSVPLTDEQIAKEWDNPDWKVGDRVSQHQREHIFEIIAVGPSCVLMRDDKGGLVADSNTSMERYYKKEVNW